MMIDQLLDIYMLLSITRSSVRSLQPEMSMVAR
jgi:hypothetical protein